MIVVDASAVAELALHRPAARAVARHLTEHRFDLHAPQLLDVEVLSVLRRAVAAGDASAERAAQALDYLFALPIDRYPLDVLARRAWEHRASFTAYDAVYLALAETLDREPVPLLTTDGRLARAMQAQTGIPAILASS